MTTFLNLTGEGVTLTIASNLFALPAGPLTIPAASADWTLSLTNGSTVVVPVASQTAYMFVNVHRQGSSLYVDVADQMGEPAAFLYGFGLAASVCVMLMAVRQVPKMETPTADL